MEKISLIFENMLLILPLQFTSLWVEYIFMVYGLHLGVKKGMIPVLMAFKFLIVNLFYNEFLISYYPDSNIVNILNLVITFFATFLAMIPNISSWDPLAKQLLSVMLGTLLSFIFSFCPILLCGIADRSLPLADMVAILKKYYVLICLLYLMELLTLRSALKKMAAVFREHPLRHQPFWLGLFLVFLCVALSRQPSMLIWFGFKRSFSALPC